jgi:GT2 family glycosyltransferase
LSARAAVSVVIPNWNGREWLPRCLDSIAAQTLPPAGVVVVDNGSTDGSLELLAGREPPVRTLALGRNTGFAHAANRGLEAVDTELVALVNTDVVLESDWLERMTGAMRAHPDAASVACKMLDLRNPGLVYDAGDFLRRDGACEQRGRFERDRAELDEPGAAFSACAGAALYRREPVLAAGGFSERYFAYLEDVDLGLRLQLRGWTCRYEPAVARHEGGATSDRLERPLFGWVERNTLLLVARWFPPRWAPYVVYRQASWAWHALRERRLRSHLGGAVAAVRELPAVFRERHADPPDRARVAEVIPVRPISRRWRRR